MINQDRLWQQVAAFRFDKAQSAFAFSQRLARENGWSVGFARRVVEEYRRFIYLAMRAGHPVTPSEAVDQAWHLHLVYTRSYWDDLCRDVLGRPLHHGPTEGGKAEDDKFRDWYQRTVESYERFFGSPPPADIWLAAQERFAPDNRFQWVNRRDTFLLPKHRVKKALAGIGAAGLATASMACSNAGGEGSGSLLLTFIVLIVLIVIIKIANGSGPRGRGGNSNSGCSTFTSGCGSSHSGCGSQHGGSGCSNDSGSSGCGSTGCGGGGCGGGD
jgi:hypothetical protein